MQLLLRQLLSCLAVECELGPSVHFSIVRLFLSGDCAPFLASDIG